MSVLALAALLAGGWLWVRQSSLVAVRQVTVTGVSGPDARQIRGALTAAARDMTTLNVQIGHLRTAVSPYPVVKHLTVSAEFPHRLRIAVSEQAPVAEVEVDGHRTPVAADGTLLRDVASAAQLPVITMSVTPGGTHVTGSPAAEVAVLAAAPYALLGRISQASHDAIHGVVLQMRAGPRLYFGDTAQLQTKWDAVTEVLADAGSAGTGYIDVTVPARPAAGAGGDGGSAASTGGSSAPSSSATGAAAGATGAATPSTSTDATTTQTPATVAPTG